MIDNKKIDELVPFFLKKRYYLNMGAGKLSRLFKTDRETIYEARRLTKNSISTNNKSTNFSKLPKILIFDIETTPIKAWVWSRWKQNIYLDQTISEWFCLSWSAKWLFDSEIHSARLTSEEVLKEDDNRIINQIWKLIDEADIVVAHNGLAFDEKKLNARFLLNGLPPASPYQTIDTKLIAAKQFGFSSNKLDALAGYFGLKAKMDTDFELWAACMNGDEEALSYMEEYNRQDVVLLEEVYLRLRPWIKSHPNVGLYFESDVPVCSSCGSEHLTVVSKGYPTQTGIYDTYRCDCGALSRVRTNSLSKEHRKNLLISVAR